MGERELERCWCGGTVEFLPAWNEDHEPELESRTRIACKSCRMIYVPPVDVPPGRAATDADRAGSWNRLRRAAAPSPDADLARLRAENAGLREACREAERSLTGYIRATHEANHCALTYDAAHRVRDLVRAALAAERGGEQTA